jgi:hypothetical protein
MQKVLQGSVVHSFQSMYIFSRCLRVRDCSQPFHAPFILLLSAQHLRRTLDILELNLTTHENMKLPCILALAGLATANEALSIYQRQVQTINQVLMRINTDTQSLNTAVQRFLGPNDIPALQQASNQVAQSVTQGAQQISQASTISLTDAVQLQNQVTGLQSTLTSTVNNLMAKQNVIVQAGAGPVIAQSLNQQLQGVQQLSMALVAKLPQQAQGIAQQASVGITNSLQMGVDMFAGQATGNGQFATNVNGFPTATQGFGQMPVFTGAASPRSIGGGLARVAGLVALMK